jgi:hypothetical protein
MILVGLIGGARQGKSTVGEELRRLAGVDVKADLEFSYPIGQVVNAWVQQWTVDILESGLSTIDIANKLIPLAVGPVKRITGLDVDPQKLLIKDTSESREAANRLLSYLEKYIEAGAQRDEEFPLPITPDNKVLHRACYQWVGARMIEEVDAGEGQDVWTYVIEKRIKTLQERGYKLVTVGGARYPLHQEMIHRNDGAVLLVKRPGIAEDNDVTEQAGARSNPDVTVLNNGTLEELNTQVDQLYKDLLAGTPKNEYHAA